MMDLSWAMSWETERQVSRAGSWVEKKDGALERSVAAWEVYKDGGGVGTYGRDARGRATESLLADEDGEQ
jgi:hypothetical protein